MPAGGPTSYDIVAVDTTAFSLFNRRSGTAWTQTTQPVPFIPPLRSLDRYFHPQAVMADFDRSASPWLPQSLDLILNHYGLMVSSHDPLCSLELFDLYQLGTGGFFRGYTLQGDYGTDVPVCAPQQGTCYRNCNRSDFLIPLDVAFNGYPQLVMGSRSDRTEFGERDNLAVIPTSSDPAIPPPFNKEKLILDTVDEGIQDLKAGDIDGDGLPDLVAATTSGLIIFVRDPASPTGFSKKPLTTIPGHKTVRLFLADFDADGDTDILQMTEDTPARTTWLMLNHHESDSGDAVNQLFPAAIAVAIPGCGGCNGLIEGDVGDIDLDGRPDILISESTTTTLQVWQNAGPPDWFVFTGTAIADAVNGRFIDADGDGDLDIVATVEDGPGGTYQTRLFTNPMPQPNTAPLPPSAIQVYRTAAGIRIAWSGGSDGETPAAALTYNVKVFESATETIVYGPNFGPQFILPEPGNAGHATSLILPIGLFRAEIRYSIAVQAVDGSFVRSATIEFTGDSGTGFIPEELIPDAPVVDPVMTPTNHAIQTLTGLAAPGATVTVINDSFMLETIADSTSGVFVAPDVRLAINGDNIIEVRASLGSEGERVSQPAMVTILQDATPPGLLDAGKMTIVASGIPGAGEYTVSGTIGAIRDSFPTFSGNCSADCLFNPCLTGNATDCYYFHLAVNVYRGRTQVDATTALGCADGSFGFTFQSGGADPTGVTFVVTTTDLAGNQGYFPSSFDTGLNDLWREADHLWMGRFSGSTTISDCGCPDCDGACGPNPDGSGDCLDCEPMDPFTKTVGDSPIYLLEFDGALYGMGFMNSTFTPMTNASFTCCHRENGSATEYPCLELTVSPNACMPAPNDCYPFGMIMGIRPDGAMNAIASMGSADESIMVKQKFFEGGSETFTFPSFIESPLYGLYPGGFFDGFAVSPGFIIPNVTLNDATGERSFDYVVDRTVGGCDDLHDEVIHHTLTFQASALRIEPPLSYLKLCEQTELTFINDYEDPRYGVNLEISSSEPTMAVLFQESASITLADVHNGRKFHLVVNPTTQLLGEIDIKAKLFLRSQTSGNDSLKTNDFNGANVMKVNPYTVSIDSADICGDTIKTTLKAPPNISGLLTLEFESPGYSNTIFLTLNRSAGSYTDSFNFEKAPYSSVENGIPNHKGLFTKIIARWYMDDGGYCETEKAINIENLGFYDQTCYSIVDETSCTGVEIMFTVYNSSPIGTCGIDESCTNNPPHNCCDHIAFGSSAWLDKIINARWGSGCGMDRLGNVYIREYWCDPPFVFPDHFRLVTQPCGRCGFGFMNAGEVAFDRFNTFLNCGDDVCVLKNGIHRVSDSGEFPVRNKLDHYQGFLSHDCGQCDPIGSKITIKILD